MAFKKKVKNKFYSYKIGLNIVQSNLKFFIDLKKWWIWKQLVKKLKEILKMERIKRVRKLKIERIKKIRELRKQQIIDQKKIEQAARAVALIIYEKQK